MVKTVAQIEEALVAEYNKGNFPATIKTTPDGFNYIEWHETNRLANQIFGFLGWSSQVVACDFETITLEVMVNDLDEEGKIIYEVNGYGKRVPRKHPEMRTFHGFKSIVRISVHAKDEDGTIITSYHDGIGFGPVTQQGAGKNPMDTAAKTAKSDGLSTAFKHFGDAFGLFLYTKEEQQAASGGSYSSGSTGAGESQDVGPRPSAGQLKGLYAIGLNDEQIAKVPFKTWKAMLDDFWNKDQSKKLTAHQVLEKYELQGTPQPTQKRSYPFQKAS